MNLLKRRFSIFEIVLLAASFLLVALTALRHFAYTPDDAFIYFQYARHILQGNGVTFNLGEPSYGVTGPLWMLLSVLCGGLFPSLTMAAKALDLFFAMASLLLFFSLAKSVTKQTETALFSTAAFAANAWFLRWASSGMETSAAVCAAIAVFWFCFDRRYALSFFCAGLLALLRPEGTLFVVILAVDIFAAERALRERISVFVKGLFFFSLPTLPWVLYSWRTFGSIVPNTASGKAGFHFTLGEFSETIVDIVRTLVPADGLSLALAIVCGSLLWLRKREAKAVIEENNSESSSRRAWFLGLGWLILLTTYYVISGTNVVSRYLLISTSFLCILALSSLHVLMLRSVSMKRAAAIVRVCLLAIVLHNQIFYYAIVAPGLTAFQNGMEGCLIPIGQWLRNNTPEDSRVVVADIGAIGYFSERYLWDAAGLITPDALAGMHAGVRPDDMIRDRLYRQFCTPDYVIHRSPIQQELTGQRDLTPMLTLPFSHMSLSDSTTIYYTVYKVSP